MSSKNVVIAGVVFGVVGLGALVTALALGPLNPPSGAVGSTGRTLDEIFSAVQSAGDKRTPITTLPFTISASGSYYLATSPGSYGAGVGITVNASNVTIDLNGNTLTGGGNGTPGTASAIFVSQGAGSTQRSGIIVRNGVIRDWNGYGVDAQFADACRFEDLQVISCGQRAVHGGAQCHVENVQARTNKGDGIRVGVYSIVRNSGVFNSGVRVATPTASTPSGIIVGDFCMIENCIASANAAVGFLIGSSCQVKDSLATSNDFNGFNFVSDCTIVGNTAQGNGINPNATTGAGFVTSGNRNRIEHNTATANDYNFLVTGASNLVIRNGSSSANAGVGANFFINAGNNYGQILNLPGSNFPDAPTGANFIY
jgi:hypothetical protein